MANGGDRLASPQHVLREQVVRCGYAPRAIQLSRFGDVLFVGCKDGSITTLQLADSRDSKHEFHAKRMLLQESRGAVRSICEHNEEHILVGRSGGALELIRWRERQLICPLHEQFTTEGSERSEQEETVLAVGRLDEDRLFASFRRRGCWTFQLRNDQVIDCQQLRLPAQALGAIRFLVPLADPGRSPTTPERSTGSPHWLLVTERGELLQWVGDTGRPASTLDPQHDWPLGERPAAVNDYGLQRRDSERRALKGAKAAFLATDTGVYIIMLSHNKELQSCRLSLSGLGAMCTALSYSEDDKYRYLWTADASGDCHLFWDDAHSNPSALNFRRSGRLHTDSQVLVCFSWHSQKLGAMVFGQARRDDRIVLGQYQRLEELGRSQRRPDDGQDRSREIRLLLSGNVEVEPEKNVITTLKETLKDFFQREDKRRHGAPVEHPEYQEWPVQALLAEFFERLAAASADRQILLESLFGPQALADKVLSGIFTGPQLNSAREQTQPSGEQLFQLWNLTLLGIIHRHPFRREAAYLALLRWLRNRQSGLSAEGHTEPSLLEAIENSIRFARKWGFYGEANAWRENLTRPLNSLLQQETERAAGTDRLERPSPVTERLDRLTYQTLLYQRGVSLVTEHSQFRMRGRNAWDLATLCVDGIRLVAVSWRWGGVEIYEVAEDGAGGAELEPRYALRPKEDQGEEDRFVIESEPLSPQTTTASIQRLRYGYSRAVHLGVVGGQVYLLTAPASAPGSGPERIRFWLLKARGNKLSFEEAQHGDCCLEEGESLYSLIAVAESDDQAWFVLGLRGKGGAAKVAVLKVGLGAGNSIVGVLQPTRELGGPLTPEATGESLAYDEAERNRVWALAKGTRFNDTMHVVVGCESGQIYRVTLQRAEGSWQISEDQPEFVARMSSPVVALAYIDAGTACSTPTRVFAGGEDGAIVAWQELNEEDEGLSGERTGGTAVSARRRFASLWATSEAGAIARISLLDGIPLDEESGSPQAAVLAMTRLGRCVLFDNRIKAGEREPHSDSPRRIPFPGCRHGRSRLGASCFAALSFSASDSLFKGSPTTEIESFAHVLSATGEGTVRLTGLYGPDHTEIRDAQYKEILKTWWKAVEQGHQLRLGGGLYRATPVLELILVRWLLDPSYKNWKNEVHPQRDGPDPPPFNFSLQDFKDWWLPRHLRPLLRVSRAWDQGLRTGDVDVGKPLELALRRAWQLDDLTLFQEICEVVLKRLNTSIYTAVYRKKDGPEKGENAEHSLTNAEARAERLNQKARVRKLHEKVLDAIERTLERWLGSDEKKEARARIVVAKNLVNGDTFWQLTREAAAEPSGSEEEHSYRAIASRRIAAVSQLVSKRHTLVSLEALRAANLSLMRVCSRLSAVRRQREASADWCPDAAAEPAPGEVEVDWEVSWGIFEPYFRHLIAAAARTFQSPLELTDALAHEYSRTFALAICACPSATIRITNGMTETQLISDPDSEDDLSHRVDRQLRLLRRIGLEFPEWVFGLYDLVARPPRGKKNRLEEALKSLNSKGVDAAPEHAPEPQGAHDEAGGSAVGTDITTVRQLRLLKRIGLEFPKWVFELYDLVARLLRGRANRLEEALKSLGSQRVDAAPEQDPEPQGAREETGERPVGTDITTVRRAWGQANAEDVACLQLLHDIVGWFEVLEGKLSTDAHHIDLTRRQMNALQERCEKLEEQDKQHLYYHSLRFWVTTVEKFIAEVAAEPAVSEHIRPQTLLLCRKIGTWADDSLQELSERYRALEIFQPEYRIFRDVLEALKRAAEAFPRSASVHKSIVEAVLGHHLLEDLDEHVLELIEIAQALDPLMVWEQRSQSHLRGSPRQHSPATAESFAHYLLGRSANAESIPKNLRTLQMLLIEATENPEEERTYMEDLLKEWSLDSQQPGNLPENERKGTRGWVIKPSASLKLQSRDRPFLWLALNELDQNDRVYGIQTWEQDEDRPQAEIIAQLPPGGESVDGLPVVADVKIRFRFSEQLESGPGRPNPVERLKELRSQGLQEPCSPWPDRTISSHGTGLYLANLAAAVVGWRLRIGEIEPKDHTVVFHLEKIDLPEREVQPHA